MNEYLFPPPSKWGGNRCVLVTAMSVVRGNFIIERLQYTNSVLGFLVFLTRSRELPILALAPPPVPSSLALADWHSCALSCLSRHRAGHKRSSSVRTPSLRVYSGPVPVLLPRLKVTYFEPTHPRCKKKNSHKVGFERPVYWGVVTEGMAVQGCCHQVPSTAPSNNHLHK